MPYLNKVVIMGNITKDLELRTTPNGSNVVNFSLAINEKYKDTDKTHFINCIAWNKIAENLVKYCKKGSCVLVEGKLDYQSWEKDGVKKSTTSVNAINVQYVGNRTKTDTTDPIVEKAKEIFQPDEDEDLPF